MPEDYKRYITEAVENNSDLEYLIAVCSFADNYPDESKQIHIEIV